MAQHERGRAYRRHQEERAKRRAYSWIRTWMTVPDARSVGRMASVHCKPCSKPWCCGNRRTMEGATWQELQAALSAAEQQEEARASTDGSAQRLLSAGVHDRHVLEAPWAK
jgi:hypothetical protein